MQVRRKKNIPTRYVFVFMVLLISLPLFKWLLILPPFYAARVTGDYYDDHTIFYSIRGGIMR